MGNKEDKEQETYSSMVNNNTILLSFEGWIKYIEGFTRGLQTTKTVDAASVMDCVGEILEYMQTLRKNLLTLLTHCEGVMEKNELLEAENNELKGLLEAKLEENKELRAVLTARLEDNDNGEQVSKL